MGPLFILENGRKIHLEDIKCLICGERMTLHNGEFSFGDGDLYRETISSPSFYFRTKQRNEYKGVLKCPNNCCEMKIKLLEDNWGI